MTAQGHENSSALRKWVARNTWHLHMRSKRMELSGRSISSLLSVAGFWVSALWIAIGVHPRALFFLIAVVSLANITWRVWLNITQPVTRRYLSWIWCAGAVVLLIIVRAWDLPRFEMALLWAGSSAVLAARLYPLMKVEPVDPPRPLPRNLSWAANRTPLETETPPALHTGPARPDDPPVGGARRS